MDVVVVGPTSPDAIAHISPEHVDMLNVSSLPLLPSPFLECHSLTAIDYYDVLKGKVPDCIRSLGTFESYNPSLDPFHDYRVDLPRKIIWTTFFDHFSDFSKACDTFMRAMYLYQCSLTFITLGCMPECMISS